VVHAIVSRYRGGVWFVVVVIHVCAIHV